MNTPNLIDLPPAKPTKLEALKAQHGIETYHSTHLSREDQPWFAVHMGCARKMGYGVTEQSSMMDCVSKIGRLMDESGVAGYGATEADAVFQVCQALDIPCVL